MKKFVIMSITSILGRTALFQEEATILEATILTVRPSNIPTRSSQPSVEGADHTNIGTSLYIKDGFILGLSSNHLV